MSNSLFGTGRNAFLTKTCSWTADTIKATLLSMSSTAGKIYLVTAASNATPIVLTVSSTTGITAGDILVVGGVGGNLAANGTWQAGTVSGTTVQLLTKLDGNNSTGSSNYTSGGWIIDLSSATVLADVSGNSVGTDVTLSGTSATLGVATASSWTWTNLPATKCWAIALYDNTSNNLIAFIDGQEQLYCVTQAAANATSIAVQRIGIQLPQAATFPTITFSDGSAATLTAGNAIGDTSIAVSALAAIVHRQATADCPVNQGGLPVTPAAGGNLNFSVDSGVRHLFQL